MFPNQNYPQQSIPTNFGPNTRQSNSGGQINGSKSNLGPVFMSTPDLGGNYPSNPDNNFPNQTSQSFNQLPKQHMNRYTPQYPGYQQYPIQQNYPQMRNGQQFQPNPFGQPFMPPNEGFSNPIPSAPGINNFPPNMNMPPQNQSQPNELLKRLLGNYADSVFMECDDNKSGFLDVREIYPAISKVFAMSNLPAPSYGQALLIMKTFDKDGNGLLDMSEFRNLIYAMNGL